MNNQYEESKSVNTNNCMNNIDMSASIENQSNNTTDLSSCDSSFPKKTNVSSSLVVKSKTIPGINSPRPSSSQNSSFSKDETYTITDLEPLNPLNEAYNNDNYTNNWNQTNVPNNSISTSSMDSHVPLVTECLQPPNSSWQSVITNQIVDQPTELMPQVFNETPEYPHLPSQEQNQCSSVLPMQINNTIAQYPLPVTNNNNTTTRLRPILPSNAFNVPVIIQDTPVINSSTSEVLETRLISLPLEQGRIFVPK